MYLWLYILITMEKRLCLWSTWYPTIWLTNQVLSGITNFLASRWFRSRSYNHMSLIPVKIFKGLIQSVRLKVKWIFYDKHHFFRRFLQFLCVQPVMYAKLASTFRLLFKLAATCIHLCYSVSQTKFKVCKFLLIKTISWRLKSPSP